MKINPFSAAMAFALGMCLASFAVTAARAAGEPMPTGIECGKPCVIQGSFGGRVLGFRLQGMQLLFDHTPIIVDGPCISACTLLVDENHDNVCITTNAWFGFHQSSWIDDTKVEKYEVLSYETPGLNEYLESRGGEPKGDILIMPFNQALVFFKACPGAV